jgi:hypothetical protein
MEDEGPKGLDDYFDATNDPVIAYAPRILRRSPASTAEEEGCLRRPDSEALFGFRPGLALGADPA